MKKISILFLVLIAHVGYSQKKAPLFDHVEPPFWWIGMKNKSLEILFHNKTTNINDHSVSVKYDGVTLKEVKKVENPHYLFVTIDIADNAKAGMVPIVFTSGKKSFTYSYELKTKSSDKARIDGFNSSDVVYLIMPDRFANGDPSNDAVAGMFEGANRKNDQARQGGDVKGISDRLNYIKDLGMTAIWLNPVLENNQRRSSYHGYAITDLYKVDRRFGSNQDYVALIDKCQQNGIKVIQDMVMNHIGDEHWLMHDLPEKDWVHQFPEFTRTNYRGTVLSDPYRSERDLTLMNDGWFDHTMPDVNQKNPLFATYLIQNSLWWIEYAGLDGIRMDTYPYPDKDFMARWAKEVMNEFPSFMLVGEVWINYPATISYWHKDTKNKDGYQSHLASVTDFPLHSTMLSALNEQGGWDNGLTRIYNLLSQDFLYPHPENNLVFLDNHDVSRYLTVVNKDVAKLKLALAFLLTTRGIPQIYYGTEILMDGHEHHHPDLRKPFPGGWKEDQTNAFTAEGRTKEQNDTFDYLKALLNWRKNEDVIHSGKLTHYVPEDNIYVYFRSNEEKTIMVVLNGNNAEKTLSTKRFAENIKGAATAVNVVTKEAVESIQSLSLKPTSALVLELKK